MVNGFEEQAYDAVCMTMGEAVWQLMTTGEQLTPDAIARMILVLSKHCDDLAVSIALSVLLQA
ncbi:hypothetical protein [Pantoea agglomerans]|jgi:hypothetical protein|uniref:hypothetical protein n=1 Tax=Enterobacter agglomerans TaxID=549 RepID=UPI0034CD12EB